MLLKIIEAHDYYSMLSVSENSTINEIRQNYKSAARKVHPDRNPAPGANEAFKAIANAAEVLSDCDKRREYRNVSSGKLSNLEIDDSATYIDLEERLAEELKKEIYVYFRNYLYVKRPSLWQRTRHWVLGKEPDSLNKNKQKPSLWQRTKENLKGRLMERKQKSVEKKRQASK